MNKPSNDKIPTTRVPYEKQRPFPVLIGVPVPSIDCKISSGLAAFMAAAAARHIAIPYVEVDGRTAEVTRNVIIEDFLHNESYKKFDYLMFFDHDCFPINPYAIEQMISHNKDIVAGVTPIMYSRKNVDGEDMTSIYFNVQREPGRNLLINELPQKLFTANKVGGNFIMIKRHVLEKLVPPYQMSTYDERHIRFITSEDYYFCDKIRANGFDIWIDPHLWSNHFHNVNLVEVIMLISRIVRDNSPEHKATEKTKEEILAMAEAS